MTRIVAKRALLPDGWAENVDIGWDARGRITHVAPDATDRPTHDLVTAAPANCHSHAFQRAMAGLTEKRGPGARDSFWTWRDLMFRFLDRITPDQVEAMYATNITPRMPACQRPLSGRPKTALRPPLTCRTPSPSEVATPITVATTAKMSSQSV